MTPRDEVRLQHMLDAARKAVEYCKTTSRLDFDNDQMKVLAVTRLLEIIGEAARGVSEATKGRSPEIPWREIAGTRDRLIHGYFNVDLNVLWRILTEDLQPLIERLEVMLKDRAS